MTTISATAASASLTKPCRDDHLTKIARWISEWQAISPFLGLTDAEEKEILESTHSVQVRRMSMLRKWKQKHGVEATYERLCQVFTDCERADFVDKIKQLLTESDRSSDHSSDQEGQSAIYVICK